jgi:hypothetical protein
MAPRLEFLDFSFGCAFGLKKEPLTFARRSSMQLNA